MTEEIKKKKLHPRKLAPPVEVTKIMMNKDKARLPRNSIIRFFKIFLGEGF